MQVNRLLVLIGGLTLVIGSRLPWISVPVLFGMQGPTIEAIEIGWEDNGFITGDIGLILLVVGMLWKGRVGKMYSLPIMVLTALALLVALGCFVRVLETNPPAGFFAAIDVGIYVTLVGALPAFIGALLRTSASSKGQSLQ